MTWPLAAALVGLGYLLGSIPVGLLVGRLVGGVDLRQRGSGRTGATNAMRTLGTGWAALVFALDVAKGAVAVALGLALYRAGPPGPAGSAEWVAAAAGVAAVVGHNWSVFIGFAGGRGVATTAGGLLVLAAPAVAILALPVAGIILRTRYVSAGSLAGAAGAILLTAVLATLGAGGWPAFAYALLAGGLVIASHADNIGRLRVGTERRIGEPEGEREGEREEVVRDGG